MISLEKQVCSLDLAKRLKELGMKQEMNRGDWYWSADDKLTLDVTVGDRWTLMPDCAKALSVAELGEMLPKNFRSGRTRGNGRDNGGYVCQILDTGYSQQFAATEADARAKMLIHLIENNLLTP